MADYVRKYTTPEQLLKAVSVRMRWIEGLDLRIGDAYLHPNCVKVIGHDQNLDRIWDLRVKQAFPGLVGHLWGMRLFESVLCPEEHVAFIPAGIDGKLIGREACMAL